ncbi:hypothetical protein DERF_001572 [Dermatophagoides farinae]|uniref:Uncharacterized protein n=1 Tax=Dermatophagoides farinae TaxID=6954 RepID=A0A922IB38_DERFA|nr:hypothetical protein DERF_001572 [Dermatophagoides farinae]
MDANQQDNTKCLNKYVIHYRLDARKT